MRKISMRQAINEALHIALNSDDTILTFGEDIAVYGGQLRCSYDLHEHFGEKRVFDTPIYTTFTPIIRRIIEIYADLCLCAKKCALPKTGRIFVLWEKYKGRVYLFLKWNGSRIPPITPTS